MKLDYPPGTNQSVGYDILEDYDKSRDQGEVEVGLLRINPFLPSLIKFVEFGKFDLNK